jgi:hypothetical protein
MPEFLQLPCQPRAEEMTENIAADSGYLQEHRDEARTVTES